jgi:peptidoglycan hydrolase-like protein with peptidoglycan-binding domain
VPTTAPQAGVIFARQPLRSGVKGDAVRLLQFQLNEHLNPTPALNVDADFGPETEKAVKAFQKMQGLKVTGIVDEDTRKALDRRVKSPAVK